MTKKRSCHLRQVSRLHTEETIPFEKSKRFNEKVREKKDQNLKKGDRVQTAVTIPFGKPNQFNILYQNIQSMYNKQDTLEAFLHDNPLYKAMCISETWLTEEKLNLIQLNGYKVAAAFCRKNQIGGGVCILLQESID